MKLLRRNSSGVSLLEMLVVFAIMSVLSAAFFLVFTKNLDFFKRSRIRQQITFDSRTCMETIEKIMRNGKARTLVIDSPGTIPYSRVTFDLQNPLTSGATRYTFYLQNNTVFGQELGGLARDPKPLAKNVTSLIFTGDSRDPAMINVTLRIDVWWDPEHRAGRASTLIVPNHLVQMVESP